MEKSKRGGLREPKGGRPPKPIEAKYRQYPLKLPPDLIEWMEANVENKNGFIVEAIRMAILGRVDILTKLLADCRDCLDSSGHSPITVSEIDRYFDDK